MDDGDQTTDLMTDLDGKISYQQDTINLPTRTFILNQNNPGKIPTSDTINVEDIGQLMDYQDTILVRGESTGINDNLNDKTVLGLYPNPAHNYLELNKSGQYEIFNITGQIIKQGDYKKNKPIDIVDLNSGMYLIRLYNNEKKEIELAKFIKK